MVVLWYNGNWSLWRPMGRYEVLPYCRSSFGAKILLGGQCVQQVGCEVLYGVLRILQSPWE